MALRCLILVSGFLTLTRTAAVRQLSGSLNATESLGVSSNASLGADLSVSKLHVNPTFDAGLLPINPTLLGILYFIAEMSHADLDRPIQADTWTYPVASGVEIVTEPVISARDLLQGIYDGIQYMVKYRRFLEVQLTLRRDSIIIGKISVLTTTHGLSLPSALNSTQVLVERSDQKQAESGTSVSAVVGSNPDVANHTTLIVGAIPEFTMFSVPGGKRMTRFDAFFVCYAALVHLASEDHKSQMQEITTKMPLSHISISMYPEGGGIDVLSAIKILTYLPLAMLQSREGFRDVIFFVDKSGSRILNGIINDGSIPPASSPT